MFTSPASKEEAMEDLDGDRRSQHEILPQIAKQF